MQINTQLDEIVNDKEEILTDIYSHSMNFKDIPGTVLSAFGIDHQQDRLKFSDDINRDYQNVILVMLDNFGWNLFERHYSKLDFFKKYAEKTKVDKIFSQFPSSTTVHVTTLYTGLPVYEHLLYDWFMYSSNLNKSISPFMYSSLTDYEYKPLEIEAKEILPLGHFHNALSKNGVRVDILLEKAYEKSPFNSFYTNNEEVNIYPYRNILEAFVHARDKIKAGSTKQFFHFYHEWVDTNSHNHGPYSEVVDDTVDSFFVQLDKYLISHIQGSNTLVMICADHGQLDVSKTEIIYLDYDQRLCNMLALDADGNHFVLGSSRAVFLKVKEEDLIPVVKEHLHEKYGDRLNAYTYHELAETGMMGPKGKEQSLSFCGDVIVLPKRGQSVWWDFDGKQARNKKGMHGGNDVDEMTVPFIRVDL